MLVYWRGESKLVDEYNSEYYNSFCCLYGVVSSLLDDHSRSVPVRSAGLRTLPLQRDRRRLFRRLLGRRLPLGCRNFPSEVCRLP